MSRTRAGRWRFDLLLVAVSAGLLTPAGALAQPEAIRFSTNFEGGSLGRIEPVNENTFRCHVRGQQDERGRNRQASWYFFRLDGVRGRDVVITLTDFVGEYNGRPGACPMGPGILPVASDDGEHWEPITDTTWDDAAKEATLRLHPRGDSVWVAHQQPYTPRRHAGLLRQVDRSADARVEVIGKTAQGRDLHLVTVTAADVPDRDKATVWLQARQHAWESGTSFVMEGALRFVTSDEPEARALRRSAVFKFTPMVDPDGCATGQVRFNANGYDVNRHWDEVNLRDKRYLTLMPEIWYVKKAICGHLDAGGKIDLMLNLHNTETAEYIETLASDEASRALVTRFQDRLVRETSFRPSRGPTFAGDGGGTANVLQREKGLLILLMEQRIARDPQTGRSPTAETRLEFGRNLIRIMAESVTR